MNAVMKTASAYASPEGGQLNASGYTYINPEKFDSKSPQCQSSFENKFKSGNRCGHNILKPVFYKFPAHHKKRIPLLSSASDRLKESYFNNFKYNIGRLLYDSNKINLHGGFRKRRSERKESLLLQSLACILHYLNLATMKVGTPYGSRFHQIGIKDLAKKIGSSLSRVTRSIKNLVDAGYITISPETIKHPDGRFTSVSSTIHVSERLFFDLGFEPQQIKFHRDRSQERLNKQLKKEKYKEIQKPAYFKQKEPSYNRARGLFSLGEIMQNIGKKLLKPPPATI